MILLVLGLAACGPAVPTDLPSITEAIPALPETAVSPVNPSPTAVPMLPTVLLVMGAQVDPGAAARIEAAVQTLAVENQHIFQVVQELTEDQITPNVAIVVGVGQGLDVAGTADRYPETVFIAIDQAGVAPADNLNVIGDLVIDQERQAFMAGYLAALISEDYKVAELVPPESEGGMMVQDSFVVGAEFFCGSCRPLYPPYLDFPQIFSLSPEDAVENFQPTVDTLLSNGVEVVYVPGALATPELLTYLDSVNLNVIGDSSPDIVRNNWVGTIKADPVPALRDKWSDWLAGSGGMQIPGSITILDLDAGLISEGRLRMFNEMAADLQAELVLPSSVP